MITLGPLLCLPIHSSRYIYMLLQNAIENPYNKREEDEVTEEECEKFCSTYSYYMLCYKVCCIAQRRQLQFIVEYYSQRYKLPTILLTSLRFTSSMGASTIVRVGKDLRGRFSFSQVLATCLLESNPCGSTTRGKGNEGKNPCANV